ncbi:MAG: NFACT RNA binding domain-containing protein [Eubacteriales bacterium]
MPFDALFLTAITQELRPVAIGSRIDRVHQPQRDAVVFHLRSRGGGGKLLVNAGGNQSRIHLTKLSVENPQQPPMFCMFLRKYLVGAKIVDIVQPPMERLLDFVLDCTDELGEPTRRHLVVELMGRSSNIVLLDNGRRILDCMRRVDFEMSEARPVLPGLFYEYPPSTDRLNPTTASLEAILEKLQAVEGQKKLDKWLMETFAGMSPMTCRELAYGFFGDTDGDISTCNLPSLSAFLWKKFQHLTTNTLPTILSENGLPKQFSSISIAQYGALYQEETFDSCSALLDKFYGARDHSDRMRQKGQAMFKTVSNLKDRVTRKLELQKKELEATQDRERLRQLGDILTSNIHQISRGQTSVTVVDFYDENMAEIAIPLSPLLSPQQNAAKFYRDYTKAKHAQQMLTQLLVDGVAELDYLTAVLHELSQAETEQDLQDIRVELEAGNYLHRQTGRKVMKQKPQRPMAFRSTSGIEIFVGRNNRQNDQLTLKTALKSEIWLHAQKIHGSHVIIASHNPDDQTVTEAAQLAAYYSQAREGQNIPVDFTPVKYVKKPTGAKPGMVIYDRYKTAYVTPDPTLPEKLKK